MKILAIDSSGLVATVAVLEDEATIAEYSVNYKKTHSETLVPMLDEIKKMTELDLSTIDAIATSMGPGSFTGLRIGAATVKGLGLALNIPVIAVPTVDAISFNMWGYDGLICPMMDARREQVYTGIYKFEKGKHIVVKEQCAVPVKEIIDECNSLSENVVFLGDGVPVYKEIIQKEVKVPYEFAPANMNRQRASSLGVLAFSYYSEGKYITAADFKPDYLRLSQAERERAEIEKAKENA